MTAQTRKALGAKIKSLRKANNLTQKRFALMIGVERGYLAKIEGGKRNPSIDIVEKVAHGLGITLAELFEGVDASSDPASPQKAKPAAGGGKRDRDRNSRESRYYSTTF